MFLLDEPFTSLETELRAELRQHVRTLQATLQATSILVSHNSADLAGFGGRIALPHAGKLAQAGKAKDLQERPVSTFVAGYTREWFRDW